MYDLDEVFSTLHQVFDHNMSSSEKDFWVLYFQCWRYLYCVNQNIEESKELQDKIQIIDKVVGQNQMLEEIGAAVLEKSRVKERDLPGQDICTFPPHIQNMKEMLHKEQVRLQKVIKDIKKEREGSLVGGIQRKKRPAKQKWMRS